MLATQTPDTGPEVKDVKQWIEEKLALSLKALQKRYVTTDAAVTSEDGDANHLCCALEAVFIHGIRSKYVHSEAAGRSRKGGSCGPLPQPVFWSLLKTVTHHDVITELERLSFVGTDVGRCRAWLRLALNHGLVECYLASLFREGSKLQAHYQPSALLLDPEKREVLLTYIQGLASLSFNLSYKSAVLNEWTTTPLALAGLCPPSLADAFDLSNNSGVVSKPKESWDTVSQSSGGSDTVEVQRGGPGVLGRGTVGVAGGRTLLNSSNLSLDTSGSSQLSSSLSSDSLLQGQDPRSPDREPWPCDLDISANLESNAMRPPKEESGHSSQDSMREDSYVSSFGPDHLSETTAFSGSDSETQGPATPLTDHSDSPSLVPDQESSSITTHGPSEVHFDVYSEVSAHSELPSCLNNPVERGPATPNLPVTEIPQNTGEKKMENCAQSALEASGNKGVHHSASMLSRKMSADSLPVSSRPNLSSSLSPPLLNHLSLTLIR